MKIWIINMTTSSDRRAFQKIQAEKFGLPVEFFDAVTPQDFSEDDYQKLSETWERPLSKGEISCFLSHHALWEKVAMGSEPMMITEDDALWSAHMPRVLDALANCHEVDRVNLEVRVKRKIVSNKSIPIHEHHLRELYLDRSGSAGYVLWPSGARKLLAAYTKKAALADKALRFYSLKSYQIEPAVIVPTDYCSRLGMTCTFDPETTVNPVRNPLVARNTLKKVQFLLRRAREQLMVFRQQCRSIFVAKQRLIQVDCNHFICDRLGVSLKDNPQNEKNNPTELALEN